MLVAMDTEFRKM